MKRLIEFSGCRRLYPSGLFGLVLLTAASFCAYGKEPDEMSMRLGGCGGVYFYAPKGQFRVEVQKQDLNIQGNKTHLRAVLFGPDRSVIEEAWIGDDGKPARSGPGPVQRALLQPRTATAKICRGDSPLTVPNISWRPRAATRMNATRSLSFSATPERRGTSYSCRRTTHFQSISAA
ncbi:MAG: hypothetical protein ACYS8Z_12520 [Planctomycetota bacterium]